MKEKYYINYADIKERIFIATKENEYLKEKINDMDTPLSKENYNELVNLVLGKDFDCDKISPMELFEIIEAIEKYSYSNIETNLISEILTTIKNKSFESISNPDVIYEENFYNYVNDEDDDEYDDEDDDEYDDEYDDVEIKELEKTLEISYEDVKKSLEIAFNNNISTCNLSYFRIVDSMLHDIYIEKIKTLGLKSKEEIEQFLINEYSKIDSRDFEKIVTKVKKDFKNKKREISNKIKKLDEEDTNIITSNKNDERNSLEKEIDFLEKSFKHLETVNKILKTNKLNELEKAQPKIKPKYISSGTKNKFSFKDIEPKKSLEALKNYGKYALVGASVGVVASIVVPSTIISGVGTIRLVYATGKFANKIVSKGFLNGEPTKVDKVITSVKEKIKNIESTKKYIDEVTNEEIIETIKFKDTKVYKTIEKINEKLKSPKYQWFINGMALGYKIGNCLNLDDKVRNLLENRKSITTIVPNETIDLQTEATVPTTNNTAVSQETISQHKPSKHIPQTIISENKIPNTINTLQSSDYSWLDIGKDGDKIDLSGMTRGYADSYAARGAYTGQYEYLNKSVNLLVKNATIENGTFIKSLILPDGSNWTGGNIAEFIEKYPEIELSKVAVHIANQNGDYAWGNLEEVLETISKTLTKAR